jgi:hypothetical protein
VVEEAIFFEKRGRRRLLCHLLTGDSIQTTQCTLSEIENDSFRPDNGV